MLKRLITSVLTLAGLVSIDTICLYAAPPAIPNWQTYPSCSTCANVDFNTAFIASPRPATSTIPGLGNGGDNGGDFNHVMVPNAGNVLYIRTKFGRVEKLFPLPIPAHQNLIGNGFPIQDAEGNHLGSVLPDSISVDPTGNFLFVSYTPVAIPWNANPYEPQWYNIFNLDHGYPAGADIYAFDLTSLNVNPNTNPNTIPVTRLTTQADKFSDATNPRLAQISPSHANQKVGTYNIGGVISMTWKGLKFFFISNKSRYLNSSGSMTPSNENSLGIYSADIEFAPTIRLKNITHYMAHLTTNSIGLSRAFDGFFFSYQANTDDARAWHVLHASSNDHQYPAPVYGYGRGQNGAHNSTACVVNSLPGIENGNWLVTTDYYNNNNNAYGALVGVKDSDWGKNELLPDMPTSAGGPEVNDYMYFMSYTQKGAKKITFTEQNDGNHAGGVGKVGFPSCAEPNKIIFSFTPYPGSNHTSAHNYFSWLVYTDLTPNTPGANGSNYPVLVKDLNGVYGTFAAHPIMSWSKRMTGVENSSFTQPSQERDIDETAPYARGMAYAVTGSASLHITDVTSYECRSRGKKALPYHSCESSVVENYACANDESWRYKVLGNTADLLKVPNLNDPCRALQPADVFGISLYLTNVKTDIVSQGASSSYYGGYLNSSPAEDSPNLQSNPYTQPAEAKKLIGVASVINNVAGDTSWKALVPASVNGTPLDMYLLDRRWAAKLTEGLAWHVASPEQNNHACGGCHEHTGAETPAWESTEAGQSDTPAINMVQQTQVVKYNAFCQPYLETVSSPTVDTPVWQDVSPFFLTSCGGCHIEGSSSSNRAHDNQSFTFSMSQLNDWSKNGLVYKLRSRGLLGAGFLDSAFGWAFAKGRQDGRNNADYQSTPSLRQFRYSPVHDNIGPTGNGFCTGEPQVAIAAREVRKVVEWLDNQAPINKSNPTTDRFHYNYDTYPPALNMALTSNDCRPTNLRVGFWDDSNKTSLQVSLNGTQIVSVSDRTNGEYITRLPISIDSDDVIEVIARDDTRVNNTSPDSLDGNRTILRKLVGDLEAECSGNPNNGNDIPTPTPSPTPSEESFLLGLLSEPGPYYPGENITFRANTTNVASGTFRLAITTAGIGTGVSFEGIEFDLNDSALLRYSFLNFTSSVVNGVASFTLHIPESYRSFDQVMNIQGIVVPENGSYEKSVPIRLQISPPVGRGNNGSGDGDIDGTLPDDVTNIGGPSIDIPALEQQIKQLKKKIKKLKKKKANDKLSSKKIKKIKKNIKNSKAELKNLEVTLASLT